jgi:hypothetical protein
MALFGSLVTISSFLIIIYAIFCVIHVVVSLYFINKGKNELTPGHLRKFMTTLFGTITVGFVYALWNLVLSLGFLNFSDFLIKVISNLLMIAFFMSMIYLASLAKDLGKVFGFKNIGAKITQMAKKKKK